MERKIENLSAYDDQMHKPQSAHWEEIQSLPLIVSSSTDANNKPKYADRRRQPLIKMRNPTVRLNPHHLHIKYPPHLTTPPSTRNQLNTEN